DIDDGTYIPMTVFESEPSIGHTLLLLLVDTSLKSLEAENDGLKGAVKARDEHIDSLRQAMQLLEHKHEPSSPPDSPWWKFWKKS
ncbi:hypothetical protein OFO11_29305, partial [Escherichia coli]|nr:hypothetical protein [Escherichia coli]